MDLWHRQLAHSLIDADELSARFGIDTEPLRAVLARYPMRITPHYLGLIEEVGDPIWRQCVPDERELRDSQPLDDPLAEEAHSPLPAVVHRYPDRVLLLVSGSCAVYCRFCTRKRKVGCGAMRLSHEEILAGIDYVKRTPTVRDVLISGGEPLLLEDERLRDILSRLRAIEHLDIIRIGSRAPVVLPARITTKLVAMLRRYQPLYLLTHFNHPRELSPEAARACARLADAGIPLGNQSVLLRGVNDSAQVLATLWRGLLRLRVRPYYLHHMDLTRGSGHFRTRLEDGLAIMAKARGQLSGPAIPQYVVDLPGGRGKVPLVPQYLENLGEMALLRAPCGARVEFPNRVDDVAAG